MDILGICFAGVLFYTSNTVKPDGDVLYVLASHLLREERRPSIERSVYIPPEVPADHKYG